MTLPDDIAAYHAKLEQADREIAGLLAAEITRGLPEATAKVWHAHPVWFLDGNPIVGYHRLKHDVRLMFWSGRSFPTPGLEPVGTFQTAAVRFTEPSQVDVGALASWLAESREIQWDYEHIRQSRGVLQKRTAF